MKNRYPPGWDAERVRRVLEHYECQTEEEAVAEDEAAFDDDGVGRSAHQPSSRHSEQVMHLRHTMDE